MGDKKGMRERFAKIRKRIRESAKTAAQATLATGVIVLMAPSGDISPDTAPNEIQTVAYHDASDSDRISDPTMMTEADALSEFDVTHSDVPPFDDQPG